MTQSLFREKKILKNHESIMTLDNVSTKSYANGKIKNRSFRILRMGSDVFFDADFESPHMT